MLMSTTAQRQQHLQAEHTLGRGAESSRGEAGLEAAGDGYEALVHRVSGQAESFEGKHAEERFGAGVAEDHERVALAAADTRPGPCERIEDLAAVGENERALLLGRYAQLFEHIAGHQGIRGPGVHHGFHATEFTAREVSDFDWHGEAPHGCESMVAGVPWRYPKSTERRERPQRVDGRTSPA